MLLDEIAAFCRTVAGTGGVSTLLAVAAATILNYGRLMDIAKVGFVLFVAGLSGALLIDGIRALTT